MQNRFGLLDMNVMPMFMIIALDIFITMSFSINCSAVICSPTVIHAISREATSETYGPRVSFPLYCISLNLIYYFAIFTFQSIQQKYQKYLLYYLSLSDLTFASNREGIDNPFIALGASCLIVCAGSVAVPSLTVV